MKIFMSSAVERVFLRPGALDDGKDWKTCASVDRDGTGADPLGQQLLQPIVLLLQLTQPLHVSRFQLAEALAPSVDSHIASDRGPKSDGQVKPTGRDNEG